ncbi:MAG: S9 family peptidase [Proteobacteria bacterium]|nr:S9 family peptidase [Pseudomonadota bacterium]MBI3499794.1 S9 family peptidase [Pseudomonadota bacterium]
MAERRYGIEDFLKVRSSIWPRFSRDGKRLFYLSDASGVPQLASVPLDGSEPTALTRHADKIAMVETSPVDGSLIYGMDTDGDERQQFYLIPEAGQNARALTSNPKAIHAWGGWSADGERIAYVSNARDAGHFDAYVMDLKSGTERRVFEAEGWWNVKAWWPDGRALVLEENRASLDLALHRLDIASGKRTPLTPYDGKAFYANLRWKKDGSGFYLTTDQGRDHVGAAFLDVGRGALDWIATPSWNIDILELSPDEKRLALVTNIDGFGDLTIRDIAGGGERTVKLPAPGVIQELKWSPDGGQIAFTLNGSTHNANIHLYDLASGTVRQVTNSDRAGLDQAATVEPEVVRFKSFDGRMIPALLYRPSGPAPRAGRGAVIFVHGGPEAQYLPNWKPEIQYLVHRGFVVLATNVRGSTGYGRHYAGLDDIRLRPDSVTDLAYAHRYLVEAQIAQAKRIAVMGGSYGGFMVLAAVTRFPDLWAAGVEFYGVANFITMLQTTGPWRRKHRSAEYGDLNRDRDFLTEISPINHIDRILAPLFVAQGLTDPRVPPSESEQVVAGLKNRNRPVEYLTFPDEGHGFVKLKNRITVYSRVAGFLDKHLLVS